VPTFKLIIHDKSLISQFLLTRIKLKKL